MLKSKKFTIVGNPLPKMLKRNKGRIYNSPQTTNFQNLVKIVASGHFKRPLNCPVILRVKFKIARPKYLTWKRKPMLEMPCTKKPDLTNYMKSLEDGLTGVAFQDDSLIWKEEMEKVYHAGDDKPETIVEVIWDDEDDNLLEEEAEGQAESENKKKKIYVERRI